MNILNPDWQPSPETIRILTLNQIPNDHITQALTFFRTKFVNTSIDDVENYENWNSLFLMFAVKAYRQINPDAYIPSIEDLQ